MKILVTGTAGFIGFHTFRALRAAGHDVLGIDNLNSYNDVRLKLARLRASGFDIDEILLDQIIESSQGGRFAKIDIADRDEAMRLVEATSAQYHWDEESLAVVNFRKVFDKKF